VRDNWRLDVSQFAYRDSRCGGPVTSPFLRGQAHCFLSSSKLLNLKMFKRWMTGEVSPMAKCWTTIAGHLTCRRLPVTLRASGKAYRQRPHHKGFVLICRFSKNLSMNKVCSVGVEAPARQGARSAHTGRMQATSNEARRDASAATLYTLFIDRP